MKKEMLYLKDSAAKMGIELSDLQLEQFDTYFHSILNQRSFLFFFLILYILLEILNS